MPIRANRFVAMVAIVAIILTAVVILCAGPAHMLMAGNDAGDGLCALGGHGVFVGMLDSSDAGPIAAELAAGISVGLALAVMVLFAGRSELPRLVPVFATDDPLHGRLSI
jgi:hypothetical protein